MPATDQELSRGVISAATTWGFTGARSKLTYETFIGASGCHRPPLGFF